MNSKSFKSGLRTKMRLLIAALALAATQVHAVAATPDTGVQPNSTPSTLQLTCPPDWNALADIDGPSSDRVILGLKARDWRKEHLDIVLAKTKECQASSGTHESVRKAELMDIQTRAYPGAVAAIDRRDQRLQQESQRAQQLAQPSAAQVPAQGVEAATPHQPSERELDKQRRDAEFAQQVARNAELDAQRQIDRSRNEKLSVSGALLAVIAAAWVWNQFVRNRCPKCRSTDFDTTNVAETDRWRGTKKVSTVAHRPGGIKGQSYKDVTKHVATTYVKKLHEYRCRACQNEWTRETKEEL